MNTENTLLWDLVNLQWDIIDKYPPPLPTNAEYEELRYKTFKLHRTLHELNMHQYETTKMD